MNSFLELYSSSDYRLTNRQYYTSTWEYINIASDVLIPFQWIAPSSDAVFGAATLDINGDSNSITGKFYEGTLKVTGWTATGGVWTVASDSPVIVATDADEGHYITSNQFTLTAGKHLRIFFDYTKFSGYDWIVRVEKDGIPVHTQDGLFGWDGLLNYPCTETDSDYTVVIESDEANNTVSSTIIQVYQSRIINSGLYYWYDGGALTASGGDFEDICRLVVTHGASTFYSDWMDPLGFTDKVKIKVSCTEDYGGVKYATGYAQWMYKSAVVRRAPKAEIEIVGDNLNGERQNEKITSAVRYTAKMKCTEAEFEALVHAIAGTLEITDADGKVYDVQNVALADASWYRTNGICELSFVDGNNVNTWSRNNSAL